MLMPPPAPLPRRPSWGLAGVVLTICLGLALLVAGEAAFDTTGFSLVMVASCLSGFRFTLTQVFLHGHHEGGACVRAGVCS